jgi:hypothetical protein
VMLVKLSKSELHRATTLGRDTTAICRMQNTIPRGEEGRNDSDIDGARAEFAVAKLYGLEPPTLNVAGDEGCDLWFGQVSIDVKFTRTSALIFDNLHKFRADVAVLVEPHGERPERMTVVGWSTRDHFKDHAVVKQMKYGEKLVMDREHLKSPESLWRAVRGREVSSE